MSTILEQYPTIKALADGADHVDIKHYEGDVSLREFVAGFINYHPKWIQFLYGVRGVFVRVLGMRQTGVPPAPNFRAEDIPMQRGERLAIFKVDDAQEDHYFVASAADTHLIAYVAIIAQPISAGRNRFYVATIVKYRHWTGVVYFNVIRPFHHVVVDKMASAGARKGA